MTKNVSKQILTNNNNNNENKKNDLINNKSIDNSQNDGDDFEAPMITMLMSTMTVAFSTNAAFCASWFAVGTPLLIIKYARSW